MKKPLLKSKEKTARRIFILIFSHAKMLPMWLNFTDGLAFFAYARMMD
jgi:hypothetical protein